MHGLAVCLSCGATAIACYLWGLILEAEADDFNSITRVIELKGLDDLLKEKTTNPLVVVSGRVGSAAPFKCSDNGPLGFVYDAKLQVDMETEFRVDVKNVSVNLLFRVNQTPWYLEDSTGRVNVKAAEDAASQFDLFSDILKVYVEKPKTKSELSEFWNSFSSGSKVVYRSSLDIGTYLTFVGEAARDKAGNLMIQEPKERPFMVFNGEGSFDKMVDKLKSDSESYIFYSKIFGGIAVAVAVMYGVDFIRRWRKKGSGNNK